MHVKDKCDLIFYRAVSLPRDKAETPTVLLWFVIPPLRRIRKELPPQSLSLSHLQELQKNFLSKLRTAISKKDKIEVLLHLA